MQHIIFTLVTKPVWRLASLIILDTVLFTGTNARNVTSFVLIAGFLLLVFTTYQCTRVVLALSALYGLPIGIKRSRRLAGSLSAMISVLVALQSIGELSPRDALVLLPLVILGYLYSFYGRAAQRP